MIDEASEEGPEFSKVCDVCGKGDRYIVDLKYIRFEKCTVCEYQRKFK